MAEYINRAYALEVIRHISEDEPWQEACVNNVIRLLNELPSIDRSYGHWIEYIDEHNGRRMGKCSACGGSVLNAVGYGLFGERYQMRFCPLCGAIMEELDG